MNVPDDVLEAMADAMLDPQIVITVKANQNFRKERIRVLSRALAAAEEMGWTMVNIDATDRA